MKSHLNAKPGSPANQSAAPRGHGLRHSAAKILEHRYERRKIREQLRRLDWALDTDA